MGLFVFRCADHGSEFAAFVCLGEVASRDFNSLLLPKVTAAVNQKCLLLLGKMERE